MYKKIKTPQIFTDFKAELVIVDKTSKYQAIYARTNASAQKKTPKHIQFIQHTPMERQLE